MPYIIQAEAKKQLVRISNVLESPIVLIGGLAVNQYVVTRESQDIDLICSDNISRELIKQLYPSQDWEVVDMNSDEYRPAYSIASKTNANYPKIKFGPKITERDAYNYLDYQEFQMGAKPFRYDKQEYGNILIPTAEALCYMKCVSFVGRPIENAEKIKQDLIDIIELSNVTSFNLSNYIALVRKHNFGNEFATNFIDRLSQMNLSLSGSTFSIICKWFGDINKINSISDARDGMTSKSFGERNKLAVFDLDGTLIKGIRHSWTLLWKELGVSNNVQKQRKKDFCDKKLSYIEWTNLDCCDLISKGLNVMHIQNIVRENKCSLTKNLVQAVLALKNNGYIVAIISGGVDVLLKQLLPNYEDLFDDVFINHFVFNQSGALVNIIPTEYDWDDNKLGVVGKNRGLQKLCEKYNIKESDTAFIGDDINDFKAMSIAGTKIYYCGDCREFEEQLPKGIISIPKNDLMEVANVLLRKHIISEDI